MEFIAKIWDAALNLLLGSGKDRALAGKIASAERELFSSGNVSAALPYRDPAVRHGLWLFKYRGSRIAAEACADAIWEIMLEEIEEERMLGGTKEVLLVPIPSSGKKRRRRGFNQTQILGRILEMKDLSKVIRYSEDVLYKIKDTDSQTNLKDRQKRLMNVKDSMEAEPENAAGKTIFLIDDITTTGATFKEGTRALKAAGAKKVLCFAVAH